MSPKINPRKILSFIIPPVITVGLCYVLYSGVNLRRILADARQCNVGLILAFLGCNLLAMKFRAMRWRLQLRAIDADPSSPQMLRSIFGTYAVNLVFPRLGEFWRCSYVSRVASRPFSGVFGTMVADRLSDTLMVALICGLTFLMSHSALTRFLAEANIPMGFMASLPAVIFYVLVVAFGLYLVLGKGSVAAAVRSFVVRMWRGFIVIFRMPRRGRWMLLTLAIWGSYILSMWLSMLAYPPTAALVAANGPGVVMVTFVFGSLAMAVPSNGGIGPWQFAIILSLSSLFGLHSTDALTFATINLGATTLLTILLGLYTFLHIALKKN